MGGHFEESRMTTSLFTIEDTMDPASHPTRNKSITTNAQSRQTTNQSKAKQSKAKLSKAE
jgi:hypothetical protein